MKIVEVLSSDQKLEFINLPKKLYKDDPYWVCPLDNEINAVFDPSKNNTFNHGEATRWLLVDESKNILGRIAAFIDTRRSKVYRQATGGIGFFEVINDKKAAFMLFDTAKEWLESRKMKAIDGPINFGENDNNWGLLTEGYIQPTFGMPYNMRYYKGFFEDYGFKSYFDQYSYLKDLESVEMFPERFMRIADWVSKRPGYTFEHFRFADAAKFVNDVVEIYNATWSEFKEDYTPLDPETLFESLRRSKPFLDEELIWFAYNNGKPIGFFILYPDLNQILKELNGSLNMLNKIKFVFLKKTNKITRIRAAAAGVHPQYQNKGVESAIFLHLYRVFKKRNVYKELELAWVGDFNPKMISIYEAIGAIRYKVHTTYRYLIDPRIPFSRYTEELAQAELK